MLKKGSFLIFCFLFLINTRMVARCEEAVSSFDQLAQAVQSAQSGDIVYLEDTIVVSGSQSLTAPGIIITGKEGFDKASMLKISPESSLCLTGITLRGNGTEQT